MSVECQWCVGGVSVECRWSVGGVSVGFQWDVGGVWRRAQLPFGYLRCISPHAPWSTGAQNTLRWARGAPRHSGDSRGCTMAARGPHGLWCAGLLSTILQNRKKI